MIPPAATARMPTRMGQQPDIRYQPPRLDVPEPPADLSYADLGDYYWQELLRQNSIDCSQTALIATLAQPRDAILQAAAAHTLGAQGLAAGAASLRQALTAADDYIAVEAAYALARLGDRDGDAALVANLDHAVPPYLSPLFAAGYLAQLGNPGGFAVVVHALGLEAPDARMLACKQLFFFVPFHGQSDANGITMDVVAQFERMLTHPDPSLQWQALTQLRETRAPAFVDAVRRYVGRVSDVTCRGAAQALLDRL
jgi:HEAT repeat protein